MRPHQLVPVPSFVISSPERDLGRKAIETHVFALVGLRIIPVERPERDLGRKAIETSTPGCTVRVPDNVVPKGTLAERLLRHSAATFPSTPSAAWSCPERDLGRKAIETGLPGRIGSLVNAEGGPERDLGRKAIETRTNGPEWPCWRRGVPKGTLAERLLRRETRP